jgi:hypothetical protein
MNPWIKMACPSLLLTAGLLASCEATTPAVHPVISRLDPIPDGAPKYDPELDQAPPVLHVQDFLEPVPLPGPINTAGAEDSPFITPDGSTLYFFFTPSIEQPPEEELVEGIAGIYIARFAGGGWSEPERFFLQAPGDLALDGCPTYWNGELWFCSAREGNYRGVDFWIADLADGGLNEVRNAGELLNQTYQIGEMHLTADGGDLYFHGSRPNGMGGIDLWVSHRTTTGWTSPENLRNLNTTGDEGWPFVSPDGTELWFTRWHQGSPAIFRSRWLGTGWGEAELIVSQFAGEPTLDAAGNLYFVHHFLDQGRLVEADLYVALKR